MVDAGEIGRLAVRMGLVPESQLREVMSEIGTSDASSLIAALERKQILTAFQTHKLMRGDHDGYFLGGYSIKYKIASGSFGRVYRAEDPRSGMPAAVKVLRRRWCEDPHKIVLFEREGKVGLRLRHPNIVQILAVNCDRSSQQYYIVMEFIEGGNLRDILAIRKRLEAKEALRILDEAASGLAYAYSRGLTHRDIKPSNILIATQGGTAKLVDFGLAELTSGFAGDDDTEVDRTVDYAGLERATNVQHGDVRSDIFFLGCVLYEMLSGKPALPPTRDRRARMQKQRFEKIVHLTKDDVDAPPAVFQLLDRMLVLDPQLRIQTPSQLVEVIRQIRAELGVAVGETATADQQRTVFVVEKNPKFQDVFRDKFKSLGFRVLMSIDANRALQRFQQQAYHAMVLDVATTGSDGIDAYKKVREEAEKQGVSCSGIILLSDEEEHLRQRIPTDDQTVVLQFPLKKGSLEKAVEKLLPSAKASS